MSSGFSMSLVIHCFIQYYRSIPTCLFSHSSSSSHQSAQFDILEQVIDPVPKAITKLRSSLLYLPYQVSIPLCLKPEDMPLHCSSLPFLSVVPLSAVLLPAVGLLRWMLKTHIHDLFLACHQPRIPRPLV